MRKRILALLLTATLTLTSIGLAAAQAERDNEIQVKIDGKVITLTNKPVIIDGRTMLPVRAIAEALDCDIIYEPVTKVVSITKEGMDPIHIIIGNEGSFISEEGRTYVPLRYIAEKFGAEVQWNGDSRTVEIKTTTSEGVPGVVEEPKVDKSEPAVEEIKEEKPIIQQPMQPEKEYKELTDFPSKDFKELNLAQANNIPTKNRQGIKTVYFATKEDLPIKVGNFVVTDINISKDTFIGTRMLFVSGKSLVQTSTAYVCGGLVDTNNQYRHRNAISYMKDFYTHYVSQYPNLVGLDDEGGDYGTIHANRAFTTAHVITDGSGDWNFDKDSYKFPLSKVKNIGIYDYTTNEMLLIENPFK